MYMYIYTSILSLSLSPYKSVYIHISLSLSLSLYIHLYTHLSMHLAQALASATGSAMLFQMVLLAPFSCPHLPFSSRLFYTLSVATWCFGLFPFLLSSPHSETFTFWDFHNFIEVIPIVEAMEPVKEPSSQESQPPAVPEAALPSTTTSTPPTTETVTAEELELLRQFRASSSRTTSPPKKAKTEKGWSDFLQTLSAKNIELSDLYYSLQQELQASEQARIDLNLTTPDTLHCHPEQGSYQKLDLTIRRPFKDIQSIELPTLEVQEDQIKDAMMQYHQNTVMPNHSYLLEACKQVYTHASLEQ